MRTALGGALALALSLGLLGGGEAQAADLRYSTTQPGKIVAVGNTLGLAKQLDLNGPGTEDAIGTFISLSPTVDDNPLNAGNPWPQYTTGDWTQNGSTAVLTLPPPTQHQVLYAELVWGGSYRDGYEDVRALIESSPVLSFGDDELAVDPDPATALTVDQLSADGLFQVNYYVRSAEVTDFVATHGTGSYAVSAVPATQHHLIDATNAAGWTLVVAYRDQAEPYRNLSIFVGGLWVDEEASEDYEAAGFCAPPYGEVEGRVVVSALEGDADRVGDMLSIAETVADPFTPLEGPNNPSDNFFCSQLNGADGLVDTQGSFGNANHDAVGGINVSGGRQGWDVTTLEVSSALGHLSNGQTSAVLRTETADDSYVPTTIAFEIDVKSPDFNGDGSTTSASDDPVALGDQFTVTARLENSGQAPAVNIVLHMPIDDGLNVTSFTLNGASGDEDGNPVWDADLAADHGVNVGEVAVGEILEVVVGLEVVGPPEDGSSFRFVPSWDHGFQMCHNGEMITGSYTSQIIDVDYDAGAGTGGSGGSGTGLTGGTGPTGGTGGAGNSGLTGVGANDFADPDEEGSCGCATPGRGPAGDWARLGLCALGAAALVRRRRRA